MTVRDIAGWDADLWKLTDGLGWLFNRPEPRETFGVFVRALLSDVPKKNSWGLAEYAGLGTPRSFEHLLDGACWDVDELRDVVRAYVLDGLGDVQGALVLDDTQVIKKGDRSVGVGPQHCGSTNQTENCQCTVMLTYASKHAHAFVDRELYLLERWTEHRQRCAAAGVPAERGFATKPQLGIRMLTRVFDEDEGLRFRWLAADSGYGRDPGLREFCHTRRVPYVMGVPVDLPLVGVHGQPLRPDAILAQLDRQVGWERRSVGAGSKGQRYYDWAAHAVSVKGQPPAEGFAHTLLIRRSTRKKVTKKHPGGRFEIEYFLVHAPVGTSVSAMIRAAGLRWNIEDDNKAGKDLVGFDQYQVRNWTPWYRHITICMLAHAYLAVSAAKLGKDLPRGSGATPGSAPS